MRRRRLPTVLALCLAAALLATGCGHSTSARRTGGSASGGGPEKTTITVAAVPLLDTAGLYLARDRKFLADEGLQVRIQPVAQSIAAMPALRNGQVDVVAGANYVTFLQAYQQGALALRILAPASAEAPNFMQLLVPKDSPVRQPKDLEGRTVAVNILNNIQSLTLNQILRAHGVDPTKVTYRAVQFPLMSAALARHDVDAVHTGEPFGTVIQRTLGARVLLDGGAAPVTGLPVAGYATTADFVTRYPRTAAAFHRAIEKAQALAAKDRGALDAVVPTYAKVDAATAAILAPPAYPTSLDGLQHLADLMTQDGLLPRRLDVAPVTAAAPSAP